MSEARRNGEAFMRANVTRYGVREGVALLRDAVKHGRYAQEFVAAMCDALIDAAQERTI